MPSSRSPPSGFGIVTRRTGLGRYVPDNSCSRIAGHAVTRWRAVWVISRPSTPVAPLLAFTRLNARCKFSLASAAISSADPVLPVSCRGQLASSLAGSPAASPRATPTLMQLRFTSFVVINLRWDFHPQECAHAGRTIKKPDYQARLLVGYHINQGC